MPALILQLGDGHHVLPVHAGDWDLANVSPSVSVPRLVRSLVNGRHHTLPAGFFSSIDRLVLRFCQSFQRSPILLSLSLLFSLFSLLDIALKKLQDTRQFHHLMIKKKPWKEKASCWSLKKNWTRKQSAVYSWSCGTSDRTSNDQDKVARLAELITKVQLATENEARVGKGRGRGARSGVII